MGEADAFKVDAVVGLVATGLGKIIHYYTIMAVLSVQTPFPLKLGHFLKIKIKKLKTKNCYLLNHLSFYLSDKSTVKTFSVFSLTKLIVFCKCKKLKSVTSATRKTSWDRGKTGLKRSQVTMFWKLSQLAF